MPLIKVSSYPNNSIMYLWQIQEPNNYFTSKLCLTANTITDINQFHKKRQLEWLVARYIIQLLGYHHENYIKDKNGKPYIKDSTKHISISHSKNILAFFISDINCGIDIQYHSPKIERIQNKFINPTEEENLEKSNNKYLDLHKIWCTKEAIYKAHGRKKISFKNDITVNLYNKAGKLYNDTYQIITGSTLEELTISIVWGSLTSNDY